MNSQPFHGDPARPRLQPDGGPSAVSRTPAHPQTWCLPRDAQWARGPQQARVWLTGATHALPPEEAESSGEPLTRNCGFCFCPDGRSYAIERFSRTRRSISQDGLSADGRGEVVRARELRPGFSGLTLSEGAGLSGVGSGPGSSVLRWQGSLPAQLPWPFRVALCTQGPLPALGGDGQEPQATEAAVVHTLGSLLQVCFPRSLVLAVGTVAPGAERGPGGEVRLQARSICAASLVLPFPCQGPSSWAPAPPRSLVLNAGKSRVPRGTDPACPTLPEPYSKSHRCYRCYCSLDTFRLIFVPKKKEGGSC